MKYPLRIGQELIRFLCGLIHWGWLTQSNVASWCFYALKFIQLESSCLDIDQTQLNSLSIADWISHLVGFSVLPQQENLPHLYLWNALINIFICLKKHNSYAQKKALKRSISSFVECQLSSDDLWSDVKIYLYSN